jgi:aromatic-L-amino-acid decarboxylase
MPPEDFVALGRRILDWSAEYHRTIEQRAVTPSCAPGELLGLLPEHPPREAATSADWDAMLAELETLIAPRLLHWQHPGFFGYFPCNASFPAILGEIATAGLGVNAMLWATSPAATELEIRVLDWCVELFGLSERFAWRSGVGGGCIQATASEATLAAMLAARHRVVVAGADPTSICVYTSEQAHSSVVKAAMIAGLAHTPEDHARVRLIPVDRATLALRADALTEAMHADLASGLTPAFVCATLGTTSSTANDPLPAIADAADALPARPWLHCDAAYSGCALVCPELRHMAAGLDRFDSLCINPHKWLLTSFDCDLFWCADRSAVPAALSITPEYLRTQHEQHEAKVDFRDWHVPLGRRMRALKLWFVLRHYGSDGLAAYIRGHLALAERFERLVRADDRFEVVAPRTTGLVCFRLRGGDAENERLLAEVNRRGRVFLSHTRLPVGPEGESRFVLRLAVGAPTCAERHIDLAWDEVRGAAETSAR